LAASHQGLIHPNDFIPFAEQTGLVKPLTAWLLEAALRQLSAWRRQGLDVSVAINLSTQSLETPSFRAPYCRA
jgi:EAL domain-containing protein (putative c-di-GMP-specific phosphodiesterase class I)